MEKTSYAPTLESVEMNNRVLYKYIRGSHAYGLNVDTSDIDTAGIFCDNINNLIGTRHNYLTQVNDDKNDNVLYELEKFMTLLQKANPNILEALFIPNDCIIYEHPAMKILKDNREKFITKSCFTSFFKYAHSQILKSRGLHKMITRPIVERKNIFDFCYTAYKQGSTHILNWLSYRGLEQDYVGIVNIPNMPNTHGLYYDWGAYFNWLLSRVSLNELVVEVFNNKTVEVQSQADIVKRIKNLEQDPNEDGMLASILAQQLVSLQICEMIRFTSKLYNLKSADEFMAWVIKQCQIERHYRGMAIRTQSGEWSNELRCSSVAKDELPICIMTYNKDAYSEHCKDYKEQKDWEANRNPARYESNLHKSYDAKNMMHCFRLITMAIEIAEGKGFLCDRRYIDREFLLAVRNHKFEYDELMEKLEVLDRRMKAAAETCNLPDAIPPELIDKLTVEIREEFERHAVNDTSMNN